MTIVQIASAKLPRLVQAGLAQGVLCVEQVPELKLKPDQVVLAKLYSADEVVGTIQLIEHTCGPHDRVRVVSGARVLNLNRPQILGILREAR
jgi:hypothetical protein